MSKRAEQRALEAYPPTHPEGKRHAKRVQSESVDTRQSVRTVFQKGYEQAEKDLALTWEDAYKIVSLAEEVKNDFCDNPNMFSTLKPITVNEFKKAFNEEVLRRFNEWRNKK